MKLNLGSKDGKNNRRLLFLNRKRKIRLEAKEQEEIKKKIDDEFKKKEKEININQTEEIRIDDNKPNTLFIPAKKGKSKVEDITNDKVIKEENENLEVLNPDILEEPVVLEQISKEERKVEIEVLEEPDKNIDTPTPLIIPIKKAKSKDVDLTNDEIVNEKTSEITDSSNYLEKQIVKIIEQQLNEESYELKKLDSEIHVIEKEIEGLKEKEDIQDIEKEVHMLMDRLKEIKRQIDSLQKTFDLDFPVSEPDNYLIYLVEEYIDKRKDETLLSDKLEESEEYKSILDKIIEIEAKQEELIEKVKDKEKQLEIGNEKIEKLNNDIINIKDMKNNIEKMIEVQTKLLDEVKIRVDEAVTLSERVDYITKSVKHSMFELFLLMGILKHNLSIKNSVIAAISAKIALDAIIKMTTPITEKVVYKVSDVKDYEKIINSCLNSTNNLEKLMEENLDSISKVRFTFEHDYKEYSYLPSYQEAIDKIDELESEMKERKFEIKKMKTETELQLDKNNAKVRKYGSTIV